jgi:hypothetical protein
MLYQLAYQAEEKRFQKKVFQNAFSTMGVFPFDPKKTQRTFEYIGKLKNNLRFEFLEAMRASVDHMLESRAYESTLITGKVSVKVSTLYLSFNLVAAKEKADLEQKKR